jgi:hypothetical protein
VHLPGSGRRTPAKPAITDPDSKPAIQVITDSAGPVSGSSGPYCNRSSRLASANLDDLWVEVWRKKIANGDVIVVR